MTPHDGEAAARPTPLSSAAAADEYAARASDRTPFQNRERERPDSVSVERNYGEDATRATPLSSATPESMTPVWELEHSVETDASPIAAWTFWTNVANWSDPPAEFELDGPFEAGSRGTTKMPGQPSMHWIIRNVEPPLTSTIEGQIGDGATFTSQWRFEATADGRTRLTQRLELLGENAAAYVAVVDAAFRPNIAAGMQKIAAAMAK